MRGPGEFDSRKKAKTSRDTATLRTFLITCQIRSTELLLRADTLTQRCPRQCPSPTQHSPGKRCAWLKVQISLQNQPRFAKAFLEINYDIQSSFESKLAKWSFRIEYKSEWKQQMLCLHGYMTSSNMSGIPYMTSSNICICIRTVQSLNRTAGKVSTDDQQQYVQYTVYELCNP